jgi:tetratricopeptide (TPR) repeat protein
MNKWGLRWGCFAAVSVLGGAQALPGPATSRDIGIVRLGSPDELKMPVRIPRGYAVVIGISKYKNLPEADNLAFAEKDAENLYSTLISKEGGNIEFENIKKLVGPQATLENIQTALESWLPSHAKETDRVVVFFVGHGAVDEKGRGYLVPYDVDPHDVARTGYPMDRLGEVISKQVKARWKVLLVDACHSGKVTVDSTAARVNSSLSNLPQGFLTLTSSRASESSFEDPTLAGGSGVFTYFLTRGWAGEADDSPQDGVVTAEEMISYVRREVGNYTRAKGVKQNPSDLGDFSDDMVLGYSPARRERISASLPELSNGNVFVEVNLDNVEVFVDDRRYGTANPGTPLRIPGLASGAHRVRGVRMGYEPVIVDINVEPGGTQTVSLRLLHQRTVKPAAKAFVDSANDLVQRAADSPANRAKEADLFSKALREDPAYSQAALGLCMVEDKQDRKAEALKSCRRALEIDPDFVDARLEIGALLMENDDYEEAVREAQRAATTDPHDSRAQTLLAEALYEADRPVEAEQSANRAIELNPASGQAYLLRAEARRAQMKFDDAIEDYTRALRLQEFRSSALRFAAYWMIGHGMTKYRSGNQYLYRPQKAAAFYGLCAAEIGRENWLRAIRYCNSSLSVDHDDSETNLRLAECYAGLWNGEPRREYLLQSREYIQTALQINPDIAGASKLKDKIKEINELLESGAKR